MDITNHIIYEDKEIIVCYKPAGIAVQTRRLGEPDLESLLRNYLAAKGEQPFIGIVHRLDQPVEGVMVFAKTKAAAAELNRQMKEDGFGKYYYAVCCGRLSGQTGTLTDYLCRDGRSNLSSVVSKDTPGAKRATLDFEALETKEGIGPEPRTLVRIRLKTGRHHQIRVQLAHAGCPLAGDRKYNQEEANGGGVPLALCAYRISFSHPGNGRRLAYEIEPKGEAFLAFEGYRKNMKK